VSLSEEVLLERGRQRGVPHKRRYFAAIGSYSVKMVANRYRHTDYLTSTGDGLFRFINNNDLKRPWTPNRGFSKFFAISGCSAHFNSELRRNGWRYTKTICI